MRLVKTFGRSGITSEHANLGGFTRIKSYANNILC